LVGTSFRDADLSGSRRTQADFSQADTTGAEGLSSGFDGRLLGPALALGATILGVGLIMAIRAGFSNRR
jgi:uncharacterized protein YjbI with pentapeptide repeats